jgi:heptosyltransferase-2
MMKILVIALSGIGDALMFSPALRLLRERYPDAHIDLLTMFKGVQELYARNPDLSNIYFYDFLHRFPLRSFMYAVSLRRHRYNVSINVYPQNRWPYNVISFLIGARLRLGHDYDHASVRSLNFLNNRRVHEEQLAHNVEENVRLVELVGIQRPADLPPLHVHLTEDDKQLAEDWLHDHRLVDRSPIVGFHAGSALFKNHVRRRWAPHKFAQLGERLLGEYGAALLLFGGPDEYGLNDEINRLMHGRAFVVKSTSLPASVALMSRCSLFVSNDSGLLHLAAGLQLPIVAIFAYTNPNWVRPWKAPHVLVRHEMECSPCFYYSPRPARCVWNEDQFRCIEHIEVDEIWEAVKEMMQRTRAN